MRTLELTGFIEKDNEGPASFDREESRVLIATYADLVKRARRYETVINGLLELEKGNIAPLGRDVEEIRYSLAEGPPGKTGYSLGNIVEGLDWNTDKAYLLFGQLGWKARGLQGILEDLKAGALDLDPRLRGAERALAWIESEIVPGVARIERKRVVAAYSELERVASAGADDNVAV